MNVSKIFTNFTANKMLQSKSLQHSGYNLPSLNADTVCFSGSKVSGTNQDRIHYLEEQNEEYRKQIRKLEEKIKSNNKEIEKLYESGIKEKAELALESARADLSDALNCETIDDAKKILSYLNYNPEVNDKNMLTIDFYDKPSDFTFDDLGVDENNLFRFISEVKGDFNLRNSNATSLVNIEKIGGDANCGNIEHTQGYSGIISYPRECPKLKDTGKLESIGGNAYFEYSPISELNIRHIGKNGNFQSAKIKDTGKLSYVGEELNITDTPVSKINDDLEHVGGIIWHNNPDLDTKDFMAENIDSDEEFEDNW